MARSQNSSFYRFSSLSLATFVPTETRLTSFLRISWYFFFRVTLSVVLKSFHFINIYIGTVHSGQNGFVQNFFFSVVFLSIFFSHFFTVLWLLLPINARHSELIRQWIWKRHNNQHKQQLFLFRLYKICLRLTHWFVLFIKFVSVQFKSKLNFYCMQLVCGSNVFFE